MIDRLPPELLDPLRKHFIKKHEGQLYLELGFYLQHFAITEVYLTSILVYILGLTDFEKLEYITRGMDARVKCERLRQAARAHKPLGENLKVSLGIFEQECISLRNFIAHSWVHFNPDTKIIYFASFGRMPSADEKGEPVFPAGTRQIHIDDLFSQAMWLSTPVMRPLSVVGPMRLANTGAATAAVRHWATENPPASMPKATKAAIRMPAGFDPRRQRPRIPKRLTTTKLGPSHKGGSVRRPK